jgi:hypothetical protein
MSINENEQFEDDKMYNVINFKLANKYKINEKNDKYIYKNQFFENKTKNEIENNTKKTKFVENKTKNEILENNIF